MCKLLGLEAFLGQFISSLLHQLQILICLVALLIGLSLSAQTISRTLCWQLPKSGPFPRTPDSQPTSLLLGSSTWKSVKTASGNSAHLSHRHWHNEAKCFGISLIAWSESLGGQKTSFLTDFWPVSPHFLSAILQAGLQKTAASWYPHFHLWILFPSGQPGILSRPLSKRSTHATLCSKPSWRPTSLRKNQSPSNGLGWPSRQTPKFSGFWYPPCSFASDTFHLRLLGSSVRRLCLGLLHGSSATFSMRSL